jgi:hypothetical protein
MFSGATRSACGFAQSAMGPFYCPLDQKVYLDTAFFEDLQRRFRGCDGPGSISRHLSSAWCAHTPAKQSACSSTRTCRLLASPSSHTALCRLYLGQDAKQVLHMMANFVGDQ